jgi:hypothetical protein
MIVITSNNRLVRERINRLVRKMVSKKLIANDSKSINAQESEVTKWLTPNLDSIERLIDQM